MRFNFGLSKSATFEIAPKEAVPAGSRELPVSMKGQATPARLFTVIVASIVVVFLLTRLDAVSSSEGVRRFIIALLDWGTLYEPFFPERLWSPVSCMWFHGNFSHIANNLLMMVAFWFLLRKAFTGKWWLLFFIVGGTLGNLSYLLVHHNPPADFTNWHGDSLDLIFMQPDTPLAGASGGVMALWGAAIAAAVRYWLLGRRKGVMSRMEFGVIGLVLPAVIQLFWFDLRTDISVAGFAHQMGMVSGFLLALLAPIQGNVAVFASNADRVGVQTMTIQGRKDMVTGVTLFLKPEFRNDADFVVSRQEMYTLFGRITHRDKVLAGKSPDGEVEVYQLADSAKVTGISIRRS